MAPSMRIRTNPILCTNTGISLLLWLSTKGEHSTSGRPKYKKINMDSNSPNATNRNDGHTWFGGKSTATARKFLIRWTEENFQNDLEKCSNIYSHYMNYKIANVLHQTERGRENDFFEYLNKHGYYLLKHVFRPKFLGVMKKELLRVIKSKHYKWDSLLTSKRQVKYVHFNNLHLEEADDHGGCEFLHHFLSGLVAGAFPEKKLFDVTLLKTDIPVRKKWTECSYHTDLSDPPSHYLNNAKSPITLYFAVDDECIEIDLIAKMPKTGRKPKAKTVKLNSGDILIFDTCTTKHRSAAPAERSSQHRVNVVLTGIEEYLNLEPVSDEEA